MLVDCSSSPDTNVWFRSHCRSNSNSAASCFLSTLRCQDLASLHRRQGPRKKAPMHLHGALQRTAGAAAKRRRRTKTRNRKHTDDMNNKRPRKNARQHPRHAQGTNPHLKARKQKNLEDEKKQKHEHRLRRARKLTPFRKQLASRSRSRRNKTQPHAKACQPLRLQDLTAELI